jgi:hypothetical protein
MNWKKKLIFLKNKKSNSSQHAKLAGHLWSWDNHVEKKTNNNEGQLSSKLKNERWKWK